MIAFVIVDCLNAHICFHKNFIPHKGNKANRMTY